MNLWRFIEVLCVFVEGFNEFVEVYRVFVCHCGDLWKFFVNL